VECIECLQWFGLRIIRSLLLLRLDRYMCVSTTLQHDILITKPLRYPDSFPISYLTEFTFDESFAVVFPISSSVTSSFSESKGVCVHFSFDSRSNTWIYIISVDTLQLLSMSQRSPILYDTDVLLPVTLSWSMKTTSDGFVTAFTSASKKNRFTSSIRQSVSRT
jgi:hypothetical protein